MELANLLCVKASLRLIPLRRRPKWVNELLKSGYSLDALRVPQQETVEPKPEPAQAQEEGQKEKSEWPL
jgi:hypothetical protein